MHLRSHIFFENLSIRRTIRDFTDDPVPREIIENCIKTDKFNLIEALANSIAKDILNNHEVKLFINSELHIIGNTNNVLKNPINAALWLINT